MSNRFSLTNFRRMFLSSGVMALAFAAMAQPHLMADEPAPEATEDTGPTLSPPPLVHQPNSITFGEGWTMHIIPGTGPAPRFNGRTYQEVYNSIPYRRSEHLANPSYRHDATMEILFGQLRPTVIHRTQPSAPPVTAPPVSPLRPYLLTNGSIWRYSPPLLRYIYPYLPYPAF